MIDLNLILPEIFISLTLMFLLIVGVFKKNSSSLIYNLTILSLFVLLALVLNLSHIEEEFIFNIGYTFGFTPSRLDAIKNQFIKTKYKSKETRSVLR